MKEMSDPSTAIDRARETYQKLGRFEKWIQQRMMGQETRNKLTDYWKDHEITESEEFAILLPNTPLEEAKKVAMRLREKIEKKKINISEYKIKDIKEISVTISIGVSEFDPKMMKDPEELYQKADKGLYIAKESGRNKVIVLEN